MKVDYEQGRGKIGTIQEVVVVLGWLALYLCTIGAGGALRVGPSGRKLSHLG